MSEEGHLSAISTLEEQLAQAQHTYQDRLHVLEASARELEVWIDDGECGVPHAHACLRFIAEMVSGCCYVASTFIIATW